MGLPACRMKYLAGRVGTTVTATVIFLVLAVVTSEVLAHSPSQAPQPSQVSPAQDKAKAGAPAKDKSAAPQPKVKLGLSINEPGAFRGYTMLNPMNKKTAYLIDMEGRVVKSWQSEHMSMHPAYLLKDGHVLRVAALAGEERSFGGGGGTAGRIQEFGWNGEVIWDYKFFDDKHLQHHDAVKLPNGNVLMVVWDKKTADEAIAAGRKKELVSDFLLPDSLVEVKPTGKTTGQIVWEWHLWNHLIQDQDSTRPTYGDVAAHPELVDLNFVESSMGPGPGAPQAATKGAAPAKDAVKKAQDAKLKSLGYVGAPAQRSQRVNPDWTHFNSVDYNATLDQIVVSVHEFSEIWIIDHGTTTAEAAGHTGGRQGKGGDLLFRWGNPRVYRAGTISDQTLFAQHNANWIAPGLPGEGHLLVFNNGSRRPGGTYSSVDEMVLPVDSEGRYAIERGKAFEPKQAVWSYTAPKKSDFNAFFISGAHRLPNGNTLICSGPNGTLFEVTPQKEMVWKYVNPVKGGFGPGRPGGPGGPGGQPRPNQVLAPFMQDMLGMSADQKKVIEGLQKTVDETLAKVLNDEQRKKLQERAAPGPGGPAIAAVPGQIMSVATQVTLKPTAEQKTQLSDLQKEVDTRLDKVLTENQRKQFKQMRADFARGGPPGGPGGPGGGPPPALFAGPPGGGGVFRAYRYGTDYAGLSGKELKPGKTVEELDAKELEKTKAQEKAKNSEKK